MTSGREDRMVLVAEQDRRVGLGDKLEVHRRGLLHRAFSVFVFDADGRLVLQRRALAKYHSPGLWSNTCCGHPHEGEPVLEAAQRRLREEMGLECALERAAVVSYCLTLGCGLIENEINHVFVGRSPATPVPDPGEVVQWRRADAEEIDEELRRAPERYTLWFPLVRDAIRRTAGGADRSSTT